MCFSHNFKSCSPPQQINRKLSPSNQTTSRNGLRPRRSFERSITAAWLRPSIPSCSHFSSFATRLLRFSYRPSAITLHRPASSAWILNHLPASKIAHRTPALALLGPHKLIHHLHVV